jgi:hypothetical protein
MLVVQQSKDLHISRICVCLDKGYDFSEIERTNSWYDGFIQ